MGRDIKETEVRVGLPLPLPVASALMNAAGAMWPDAQVRMDPHFMTILIPDRPPKRVSKAALRKAAQDAAFDDDDAPVPAMGAHLSGVTADGTVQIGLDPNEAWEALATWALTVLENAPDATNYVEQAVTLGQGADSRRFALVACWAPGRTPHDLRMKAEQERDQARAEVARLKDALAEARNSKRR